MICLSPLSTHENTTFRVSVIHDFGDLMALKEQWNRLYLLNSWHNPFASHIWITTFTHYFPPNELFVITVTDEHEQLVGIAPLQIKRRPSGGARRFLKHLQFIGTDPDVYDYQNFLLHPDYTPEQIVPAIAACILKHRNKWDVLDLRFMSNAEQIQLLEEQLEPHLLSLQRESPMSFHYIQVPPTVEEYHNQCKSRNLRRDLKRIYNKIEREYPGQPLRLENISPSPKALDILDNFFDFHTNYWLTRGKRTNLYRFPKLRAFYKNIYMSTHTSRLCKLDLHLLRLGDEILAYELGFNQNGDYYGYMVYYNTDYQKIRPGCVIIEELLKRQIKMGKIYHCLGRGDCEYKNHWQAESFLLHHLLGVNHPVAKLGVALDNKLKQLVGRS